MSLSILDNGWAKYLNPEFKKDYFKNLQTFLENELKEEKEIYPPLNEVFTAFQLTDFSNVKVVIIGQDPYHGEGQAHGLSFSVKPEITKIPPSLKNIYKELKADLDIEPVNHGFLKKWADEGVLMINSVLTVEKSNPGSHRKKGWENFTDKVISILNEEKENLVFILWGNDAKKKALGVNRERHLVLESAHPSPFSVKKFYGCKHFSKTNHFLKEKKIPPIKWDLN
jgi:uracil-DNA glycosylase